MRQLYAASPYSDEAVDKAKVWIKENGYNKDNVRLYKSGDLLIVEERNEKA